MTNAAPPPVSIQPAPMSPAVAAAVSAVLAAGLVYDKVYHEWWNSYNVPADAEIMRRRNVAHDELLEAIRNYELALEAEQAQ